ncbi:hypothetical protein I545_4987 [Mycobacterium kansasii 662]|uniref:Uncharacterized protein n=2 Tax=Mycobacterium kansasii TaxID=1768 RepID=A0A1V3WWB5_MYCKA|nr:hypothetical protein I545_4987 [Mycobacterium kansasii 662]OOK71215.1 hypothetical protein BZL29_5521 [Mycobacterium kansasii]
MRALFRSISFIDTSKRFRPVIKVVGMVVDPATSKAALDSAVQRPAS